MDNNTIKKWLDNSRLIVVLYIVLVIIILVSLFGEERDKLLKEGFSGNVTTKVTTNATQKAESGNDDESNKNVNMVMPVHSILPSFDQSQRYYGVYLSAKKSGDHLDNFIYTNSLESNKWLKPVEDLSLSEDHIIVDLSYDSNKRLTAIGLSMANGTAEYDIFKKSSSDFKSDWILMESNKKMRSLCNDLKNGSLLGCSSYDGQIYESKNRLLSYKDWFGPVNFDKPMRKIMFDKEGYMIGIGLVDNYIYRKKTINWRESKWDTKNYNKTKVYDLVYDNDGCFIATTKDGIKKQTHPDFNSLFVLLKDFNQEHEDLLDNLEILKFKTGNEYLDEEFDTTTELGRDLKRLYEFKKISKDLCSSKGKFNKGNINPDSELVNSQTLNRQNDEINELYSMIDDLTYKLGM